MPCPTRPLLRPRSLGLLGVGLLGAFAVGCASVPPPLVGTFSPLSPRESSSASVGSAVRWGGRIVAVEAVGERTCFRLIAQPLGPNGQPDGSDTSLGRFSACRAGNYDARTFAPNREITVTGRIEGFDAANGASSASAPVPRLAAQAVVLWPRRR
jgi:outer membrane lipoprotein